MSLADMENNALIAEPKNSWGVAFSQIEADKKRLRYGLTKIDTDQLKAIDEAASEVKENSEWHVCFTFCDALDSIISKWNLILSISHIHELVREELQSRNA